MEPNQNVASSDPPSTELPDLCYRCGYDLRGITDDHPCPECGLLAIRSRRQSEELHNSQPRWLRNLHVGTMLILLVPAVMVVSFFSIVLLVTDVPLAFAPYLAAPIPFGQFWYGTYLLSRPEGYALADLADRPLRRILLPIAALPMLAVAIPFRFLAPTNAFAISAIALVLGLSAYPLFLFLRLRGLAKRIGNDELAEYCAIVGIGAMLSIDITLAFVISMNWNWWNSPSGDFVEALLGAFDGLFLLWGYLNLIRFAMAFSHARRKLRDAWTRDDRAIPAKPGQIAPA